MKPKSNARPVSLYFACNSCGQKVEENGVVLKVYTCHTKTGTITCHACAAKLNFPKP